MLHYLFTNDMRRKKWPDILVESANLIKNDQVPSATTDKSKNNYINTQQAYLGFYKGSKINEVCSNGDVNAVILNFVNRFQYPNTRTQDSYENAVNDGMCVAPLRLAVQLLFVLNLIDKKEAHISYDELVKYIVCDLNVAKGIKDILSVANQIVLDRKGGIKPLSMPSTEEFAKLGVEWKECPRQIKELFGLLEYVPFITLNEDVFSLVMPPAINPVEAKIFFYIVNNKGMWKIPAGGDWEAIKESYKQYFESGIYSFIGTKIIENYEEEFVSWWRDVEKKNESTARDKYLVYLRCLNKPYAEPNHSTWPGIYPFLFGEKAKKEVVEIGELGEFDTVYGPFCNIFSDEGCPTSANKEAYERCVQWIKDVSEWACLSSAFKAYRKFLEWREEQKKPQPLPAVDRLSIALKLFAEKRSVDKPGGVWESYDAWTKSVRSEFVSVNESILSDATFNYLEYFRKYAVSSFVANTSFARHSSDEKCEVLKFLKSQKDSPKSASWYIDVANRLVVGGNQVDGMTPKSLLYFMSELHPEEFAAWTEPTYEQLSFLGLHHGPKQSDLTIETYEDCKAKQQLIVAKMKELKIGKASDDPSAPDYRTANEFLWWLGQDDNKDLIKEKIMAKMFKNASKKTKTGARKLSKAVENDEMMQRLMAALRTKPFAILAGHSGTGKSQLVRRLAYMTCNDEELLKEKDNSNAPGNYCMVQVKPNWHDSTDLLGYYTEMNGGKYHTTPFVEFICKAYAYPETPFFVCLDEMNLASVEQYFAEFLSAIESYSETTKLTDRLITEKASPEEICGETKLAESLEEVKKHGLTIPRNLFVVGTVNVDETTCQFSRKVLDRAMTILMTAVSFKSMTEPNDPSKEECLDPDGIKFFLERPTQTSLVQGQMDKLDAIQKQVGDTPFAIAYRFANEYALYQSAYQMLMSKGLNSDGTSNPEDDDSQKAAIDHVVLMKLLPRIHGARPEMKVWFNGKNGDVNKIGLVETLGDGQSVDMMKSILARVGEYLSFWP